MLRFKTSLPGIAACRRFYCRLVGRREIREITNIVSGYIDADFLTGNVLKLNLMAASYWGKEGEFVENKLKTYLKYKITNGLNISFAVSHVDIEKTQLTDYQIEIKYSI